MTIGNNQNLTGSKGVKAASFIIAAVVFLWAGAPAHAQTTFDVIGPHEYDLPVNYSPFNAFVQYGIVQNNNQAWAPSGKKVAGNGSQLIEGLSKYVHFWTPNFSKNVGFAYEVIQPEVAIRNDDSTLLTEDRHISGFGDTMTGFAAWYRPTPKSTLGIQTFLQVPVGNSRLSDTNWKNYTSLLWYTPLVGKLGWTGDAGFVWQSKRDNGTQTPGFLMHTNNRLGYQVTKSFEPYIGIDYEHINSRGTSRPSRELDGGLGFSIKYYKTQSIAFRYSRSLSGANHSHTDSWNLRYAVVW